MSNVNFGQGLAVTSAGQIAVGAFGADGGFGKLYLFSSIRAGSPLPLLNDEEFTDPALQSCVTGQAAVNAWATVGEVIALDCSNLGITDLEGLEDLTDLTSLDLSDNDLIDVTTLESLTNLTTLDLTGNVEIDCSALDTLEIALGIGVVTRPDPCAGGTQSVQNLHNAMGQRAVKSVDGGTAGTIHFIYDQSGQVIAEIDGTTGVTLREYIYVNGMQVALVDDTGTQDEATYFVHTDHLATPQKITDSAQTVVWSGSYEPFGEVEETIASIENNIRFPGQYEDGETGLHYNYFRDYDSSLGRYVESDPIGLVGGVNTYSYVYSSPILYQDFYGLQAAFAFGRVKPFFPQQGPFGGVCGEQGSPWAHWLPDATEQACQEHDDCWFQCQKNCDGPQSNCRKVCDSKFGDANPFYAAVVKKKGDGSYNSGLEEFCKDDCQ